MLKEGTSAPDFTLFDQDGKGHTLSDYQDAWKIVYFYPRDNTPGCTKEACAITEVYNDFEKKGVKVFGLSKDSIKSHKKFAEKFSIPFALLSDESTKTIQAYKAWQKKKLAGREYMGIVRVSYLLDEKNVIIKAYPKVTPAEHAVELLNDIKLLKTN